MTHRGSFRDELKMLRTVDQKTFEEEMMGGYGMSAAELTTYQDLKHLKFCGATLTFPYFCQERSHLGWVPIDNNWKRNNETLINGLIELIETYEHKLPAIEVATLKEKLWHLDRSQQQYLIEAIESYIQMACEYRYDDNPEQYIAFSVDCLFRSYQTATILKKQLAKNAEKLSQIENSLQSVVSLVDDFLKFGFSNEPIKIKVVKLACKLSLSASCSNFDLAVDLLLKSELTPENDDFFINSLYPALLNIHKINDDWYFNKVFSFAKSLIEEHPFRVEPLLRGLMKFCNDKGYESTEEIQAEINRATKLSIDELLKSEYIMATGVMEIKVNKPNFDDKSVQEIIEYFQAIDLPKFSQSQAIKASNDFLLGRIATLSVHDSDGRLRANNLGDGTVNLTQIYNTPFIQQSLVIRSSIIKSMLISMNEQELITKNSLRNYFSSCFPDKFSLSLADSLFFLIQHEFHIAMPVLVPRLESILKHGLGIKGISSTTTQSDKLDKAKGLDNLIKLAHEADLINEDDVFYIKLIFIDEESGNIVRHEVAHGSLSDEEMETYVTINAAHFIYYLAFKLIHS